MARSVSSKGKGKANKSLEGPKGKKEGLGDKGYHSILYGSGKKLSKGKKK